MRDDRDCARSKVCLHPAPFVLVALFIKTTSRTTRCPRVPSITMLNQIIGRFQTCIACISLILFPLFAQAARQVTLAWDPSPDSAVLGYRIHYGTTAGSYGTVLDVGSSTTATIANLSAGTQYYFAVTAYSDAIESLPSNEIAYATSPLIPPSVQITTPTAGIQVNGPATVNVSAQATDPDGVLARVELYSGASKVSEATAPPYDAVLPNLPVGQHSLSAVAIDQSGTRWPSTPVMIDVVALRTSQCRMKQDGAFEVSITGAIGSTNRVWYSTDLVHWELLQTVQNTSGNFTISDPGAKGATQRFYKVTSP